MAIIKATNLQLRLTNRKEICDQYKDRLYKSHGPADGTIRS